MIEKIAYLAPEIPSLSATFVYNEILALQDRGLNVISISVHHPQTVAKEEDIKDLLKTTYFIYQQKLTDVLTNNLEILIKYPRRYCLTLWWVLSDIFRIGPLNPLSIKILYQFLQASQVAKILENEGCEHLHIHFAHVPTQIGMYASSLTKIPFSFTSHANDLFERGMLLKQKVERSKAAIAISDYNRHFLLEQGCDPEKIKIVRCGINTSRYAFIPKQTISQTPSIVSLGRLVEKKGMDTLIVAAAKLLENNIDVSLEIGGDGLLMESLNELASQYNLQDRIQFKGALSHDEVFPWMKKADLFILACKEDSNGDRDGIPVVLMEAMAAGIPVVSTEISGIPELIDDGVCGFLAQPNDPDSLASAIAKMFKQSDSIAQMTQAARQKIVDEFDQDKNIDRLLEIFNGHS